MRSLSVIDFCKYAWMLAGVWLFLIACEELPTEADSDRVSVKKIRGITLASWLPFEYESQESLEQIAKISDLGANHLTVLITAYQPHRHASFVAIDSNRTPRLSAVRQAVQNALAKGMQVTIKPHIDVDDGTWRAKISPRDPAAWFASYQTFLLPLARMADSLRLSPFIIGTELTGTLQFEKQWLDLIRNIRSVYSGKLVYAASWDEAYQLPFWEEMDYAGINFYAPVTNRREPGKLEILAGWQFWMNRVERLHNQIGKPIVFTEIGYRSIDGAGMAPHEFGSISSLDMQEQADLYWAAFQATSDADWIKGMLWWNWLANGSGGIHNDDYTPAGKPATQIIRSVWQK